MAQGVALIVHGGCVGIQAMSRSSWRCGYRRLAITEFLGGCVQQGRCSKERGMLRLRRRSGRVVVGALALVDPWAPTMDSQSMASSLFAASLFPYLGFLYHITKSKTAPPLTLFGFYFLLAFVGATIPAGIYAKIHYGTSLSNVDWLHGGAESLLTLTNLFIVVGLRDALRNPTAESSSQFEVEDEENVPLSK